MDAPGNSPFKPTSEKKRFTRRGFLRACLWGGGAATLAGSGTLAHARFLAPFATQIERRRMLFSGLPAGLDGLTLLHLTDLHLADPESHAYLQEKLEQCRGLSPDLLVLTGDYLTQGDLQWIDPLEKILSRLQSRHGAFAVLGNHDYCVYRHNGSTTPARRRHADLIAAALKQAGFDVLRNESRRLSISGSELQFAGIDDLWSGNFSPDAAFRSVDPSIPCIALGHNPDMVDRIQNYPWSWLLAGHTHGGQVRLPLIGAPLLPLKNKRYDMGEFEFGDKRMYVSRGIGYLRPLRFNCPPEVTLFTLVSSTAARPA